MRRPQTAAAREEERILNPKIISLDRLRVGERGHIRTLQLTGAMRRRLQDLGLICGTPLSCYCVHPSGTLAVYHFRGTLLALRGQDARQILVEIAS